jgi:hypothetical protein
MLPTTLREDLTTHRGKRPQRARDLRSTAVSEASRETAVTEPDQGAQVLCPFGALADECNERTVAVRRHMPALMTELPSSVRRNEGIRLRPAQAPLQV